jgi:hypothetical protein
MNLPPLPLPSPTLWHVHIADTTIVDASKVLEESVVLASSEPAASMASTPDATTLPAPPEGRAGDARRLASLFDLGMLRFHQRDQLLEAFRRYRQQVRAWGTGRGPALALATLRRMRLWC